MGKQKASNKIHPNDLAISMILNKNKRNHSIEIKN